MIQRRTTIVFALALLVSATAFGSWYDDYDAGLAAVRKGQWSVAAQKMSAAIAGNSKESNAARTYGNIFINYHPYYYRGLANLNMGKYAEAIKDLETTSGPGEIDQGSIDSLIRRAKEKLEEQQTPTPVPVPAPPTPTPTHPTPPPAPVPVPVPVPSGPTIDPALRNRAMASVNTAKQHLADAAKRKAGGSPQYGQALQMITAANTLAATAKSNDDLNAAIAQADNASLIADSAQPPGVAPLPVPTPTRPIAAVDAALSDTKRRFREAVESYYRGDFDEAAPKLEQLAKRELPNNGWVWAFLGAAQYGRYAFELDDSYKESALDAFRHAKKLGTFKNGLPQKYFSKRIRNVFASAG